MATCRTDELKVVLFAQQIVNGLVIGSTYAVVALGFSLVFSVMRVANMAHPEIFMVGMFIGLLAAGLTQNLLIAVLLAAAVGAAVLGLAVERTVLRPLRSPNLLIPLLGTIGASLVLQNVMAAIVGPDPVHFPSLIPNVTYTLFGITISSLKLVNLGTVVVLTVGVSYYVRATKWGRASRAIAERADVASAFGVDVNRVAQLTVVISSAMAALGGVSIALLYGSAWVYVSGLYTLKSVICMLVGGDRHLEGVVAVGLALGVIEALVAGYVSSSYRDVAAFVILIAVLYVRPKGIFGSYEHA